jgi:hypothetical protein
MAVKARLSANAQLSLLRLALPKLDVAGSSPVARSDLPGKWEQGTGNGERGNYKGGKREGKREREAGTPFPFSLP